MAHATDASPPPTAEGDARNGRVGGLAGRVSTVDLLWLAALAIVASVTLFHALGRCSLGAHEAYAAVPAREMLGAGDWIVPRFGGLPRLNKPPLGYWILAAAGAVVGDFRETTLRLPSALSAVLLAALVGIWAGQWYGRTAGYGAALVQLTAVWVVTYGRKAEVDMALCLLTTAALYLVARQFAGPVFALSLDQGGERTQERTPAGWRSVIFSPCWTAMYALFGLAWLAKFHYGPALVLAVAVVHVLIQRRPWELRFLLNPIGLALFAAAVTIWPWLVLRRHPEAWGMWWTETVGRALGELRPRPVWYYVPKLSWLTLPWTPLAAWAAPGSWRRAWRGGDPRERFLWVWLLVQVGIVSLSANKHTHYLFAALPMVSLLAGQGAAVAIERLRAPRLVRSRPAWVGLGGGVVFAASAAFAAIQSVWPDAVAAAARMCAAAGAGGFLSLWLLSAGRRRAAGLSLLAAGVVVYGTVVGAILPNRDSGAVIAEFADTLRADLAADQPLCAYRIGQHRIVYDLGEAVRRQESAAGMVGELDRSGVVILLTRPDRLGELQRMGDARVIRSTPAGTAPSSRDSGPLVLVRLTSPAHPAAN